MLKYDEFKNKKKILDTQKKDLKKKLSNIKKQQLANKVDKYDKQKQDIQKKIAGMNLWVAGDSNYK